MQTGETGRCKFDQTSALCSQRGQHIGRGKVGGQGPEETKENGRAKQKLIDL